MEREEMVKREEENYMMVLDNLKENFDNQLQLEQAKKNQFEKDFLLEFKDKDRKKLDSKLVKLSPNIKEVNLIAKEFKRDIQFSLHLTYYYIDMDNV